MAHQFRFACVVAFSFLASVALAQGQTTNLTGQGLSAGLVPGSRQSLTAASAFPGQASSGAYTFASSPKQADGSQPQGNGSQDQSQSANQNQGMAGTQTQNRNGAQNGPGQNQQGQGKQEAPPEKPHYLTYTPKQKSIQEEVKSGKALDVDFKSVPPGAEVTVDGYFLGHTPMTAKIPLGQHLVTITKWGYRSWSQELDVANGKTLSVNPSLHKDW